MRRRQRVLVRGCCSIVGLLLIAADVSPPAHAAWPAIQSTPDIGRAINVSADGSTIVGEGLPSLAWNRHTQSITEGTSLFLFKTSATGSFYPPSWTPHPSWAASNQSPAQPWPVDFLPMGLSDDESTYFGTYLDGPIDSLTTKVRAARYSLSTGLDLIGAASGNPFNPPQLPNYSVSGASADGQVIVGTHPGENSSLVFRWTVEGGLTNLAEGYAAGISADGGTVVGVASDQKFFMWTAETGVVNLGGHMRDFASWELGGVNADGSRIAIGDRFWTPQTGSRDFKKTLIEWFGLSTAGWSQMFATDISDDGRVIVGVSDQGNFVVTLPALGDADGNDVVDVGDYTTWADNFLLSNRNWQTGDFTGDGKADIADYTVWADHFLTPVAQSQANVSTEAVPEPSTLMLLALAAVVAWPLVRWPLQNPNSVN